MASCCGSKKTPAPNDACPCGSGKKFKDCCGKK
ncbi:MAG: SEC-C metal-binding domain-containing protein [Candidatus Methanoperedens sp.]